MSKRKVVRCPSLTAQNTALRPAKLVKRSKMPRWQYALPHAAQKENRKG